MDRPFLVLRAITPDCPKLRVGGEYRWSGLPLKPIPLEGIDFASLEPGRELHREGLLCYSWGWSEEPEFADTLRGWHRHDPLWAILRCDQYVRDKGRDGPFGKLRVELASVVCLGTLAGAVQYLREHWDETLGDSPRWEIDERLFPPPYRGPR